MLAAIAAPKEHACRLFGSRDSAYTWHECTLTVVHACPRAIIGLNYARMQFTYVLRSKTDDEVCQLYIEMNFRIRYLKYLLTRLYRDVAKKIQIPSIADIIKQL